MPRAAWLFPLLVALAVRGHADGMLYKSGKDISAFYAQWQKTQQAVLHHDGRVQRMLIAVQVEMLDDEEAIWIVPVLAPTDEVRVGLADRLPRFEGHDPRRRAVNNVASLFAAGRATLIFPALALLPSLSGGRADVAVARLDRAEKWGVEVEAVRAESVESLRDYAASKGATIPAAQLASFASYMNGEFAFVLARVASREAFRAEFPLDAEDAPRRPLRTPCIYVESVCDEAFYPMRATSGYGDKSLPFRVVVSDFVEPECHPELRARLGVSHYVAPELDRVAHPPLFKGYQPATVEYTAIWGGVRARDLIDDFRFRPAAPAGMRYARSLAFLENPAAWGLLLVVSVGLLSAAAGALAGAAALGSPRRGVRIGIFNLLTIVGVMIEARHALRSQPTKHVTPGGRTWAFAYVVYVLLFAGVFITLSHVAQHLFLMPLLPAQS